jgi:hypothetical protein
MWWRINISQRAIRVQVQCQFQHGKGSEIQMLSVTKLNLPESIYSDMAVVVDISDYSGMLV